MKKAYQPVDLTSRVKERIMSLYEVENQEELNKELDQFTEQVADEKRSDRQKMIVSWISSLFLHATCLMVLTTIYFITVDEVVETPPVRIMSIAQQIPKTHEDKIDHTELMPNVVIVESDVKDPDATVPVTTLNLIVENKNSSDDDLTPSELKKGREEAISDSETGSNAFNGTIGAGGPSSGMFGNRKGGGDHRSRMKMGPMGKPATAATDAGLRWLKKHQSPNGMWDAERYFQNCTDAVKCEPGSFEGIASDQVNVALTGYGSLCFLGGGYDHKTPSKYRSVVAKSIAYLLSIQKPDGMVGDRNYEHAIATMALVEAYGMSNDPDIRKPAQLAVDALIARQTIENKDDPYSGLLWDYGRPNPQRLDISVTGWNIMALKSAHGAGLNVKDAITGSRKALERVWKAANPDWEKKTDPYKDTTIFPYTWNSVTNKTERDHLSFVGATCLVFMGHKSGDIMLETLLNDSVTRWVDSEAYKKNMYACYYLSLSMFQAGGDRWEKCLRTIIPNTIDTQNKGENCASGSWDWEGQTWHGSKIGRVLTTEYNILNLQVAYRYAQVNGGLEKVLKKK
jgi:hypothetical protein